jgi:HK97 gp10 family phage protein
MPYVDNSKAATKEVMRDFALGIESIAISAWRHARLRHPFRNQTGSLEGSIRVEKRPRRVRVSGVKLYDHRLVAGTIKRSSGEGFQQYAAGRPGGPKKSLAQDPYYAIYVELGTSKMAARPYIRPAVTAQRAKFRRLMKRL